MKRDARVDAYIANAAAALQPILQHIRARVEAVLPETEETIKWGGPAYTLDGKLLLITHAFKGHAALSFWRGSELRGEAEKKEGMGQFGRITSLADLPADAELDELLRSAAEMSRKAPAPRKPKHAAPPATPHPDFIEALQKAPKAAANFEAFAPSHRREYYDWINSAKRDETRVKRIATAIEWLSEGKKQNWKYEKC